MSTRSWIQRSIGLAVPAGAAVFLALEAYAFADLYAFEAGPLATLVGWRGAMVILLLNLGLLALCFRAIRAGNPVSRLARLTSSAMIGVAILLGLWAVEWMFMETPLSSRLQLSFYREAPVELAAEERRDFDAFSLVSRAPAASARDRLAVMYARTAVVNPEAFRRAPLGATIDRYGTKYGVDPTFLFFRAYLNSYYGEATSGRVPFLRTMTSETIRDIVQIHLPSWFVESPVRQELITSDFLEKVFGKAFGWKLRYAFHKATLDVSTQSYDLNTYSDTFLILELHPEEFPDIFGPDASDPLDQALRDSFLGIRDVGLREPYESPYEPKPMGKTEYAKYRSDLARFARAAYYKTALDFDFATRIQGLLAARDQGIYRRALGAERWDGLPAWQRDAMLNMTRDVYEPNVGRLSYNLYALPELNRTPINFVVANAVDAGDELGPGMTSLWRPGDYEELWAAAGYQLTVLNEVWSTIYGPPIPGIHVADTLDDARKIIWLDSRCRQP